MYYGEENDCASLEDKAMHAFSSILKMSKIEKRIKNVMILMEVVVEKNLGHPRIIEAIEH
jgi:hypothetical protein